VAEDGAGNGRAGHRLVIVESPAKAKTIAGYLGSGYVVESSIGHIRDLPQNASDVPARLKGEPWARLGVDVDNDFTPYYVVSRDKKPHMTKLKGLLKEASELYLATDEDREGEAIAWHLREELRPKVPVRRMVFHEITRSAIQAAVENPRELDLDLVEAQEARRILDRLYGYEVSPVLWKKVMPKLSAGRVQSVATRLVVDRERARIAFRSASYWDVEGQFDAGGKHDDRMFPGRLHSVGGKRVARGSDFDATGAMKSADLVHLERARTESLVGALRNTSFEVRSVESKPYTRRPYAPFRTTTLQQEASRKLGMSAAATMSVAQRLYENGFITYMRTDSTTLSASAVTAARDQVRELYGAEYLPDEPRLYTSKVKNAQEAHEAIRPAGDVFRTPAETGLSGQEFRVYELIWMRTVASQMKDAVGRSVSIRLGGAASSGEDVVFAASGRVITFHGFLKAYVEGSDDPDVQADDSQTRLPAVSEGDVVSAASLAAVGHETKPPARYTEATLVRELEEREIGRPSTYASIIGTILNRGYVYKKGTALVPSWIAFAVVRLLEEHFARLVSYEFTAGMEDVLDEIAGGRKDRVSELAEFYFGSDKVQGLHKLVTELGDIDARELSTFPVGGDDSGVVLRVGRYGPYVEDGDGNRGNVPDDLPPDELTVDRARELIDNQSGADKELGTDPETGLTIVAKPGRYGPYVTEVLPEDTPTGSGRGTRQAKPRTASLFKSMSLDTMTLHDALTLLQLPRVVGVDPESGEEITAQNGRYGPYLKRGSDSRSIESEEQLLTITLEEALEIYSRPKQRGRAAANPGKELGEDPATGAKVTLKSGRFGPYVTDGEYNATLRQGDAPESITLERAAELLADKRAKGPATKKRGAKKVTKKAAKKTTKKAAAKKTTKKSTAKKTSTKSSASQA
jgi:DNA topoisomerase I